MFLQFEPIRKIPRHAVKFSTLRRSVPFFSPPLSLHNWLIHSSLIQNTNIDRTRIRTFIQFEAITKNFHGSKVSRRSIPFSSPNSPSHPPFTVICPIIFRWSVVLPQLTLQQPLHSVSRLNPTAAPLWFDRFPPAIPSLPLHILFRSLRPNARASPVDHFVDHFKHSFVHPPRSIFLEPFHPRKYLPVAGAWFALYRATVTRTCRL